MKPRNPDRNIIIAASASIACSAAIITLISLWNNPVRYPAADSTTEPGDAETHLPNEMQSKKAPGKAAPKPSDANSAGKDDDKGTQKVAQDNPDMVNMQLLFSSIQKDKSLPTPPPEAMKPIPVDSFADLIMADFDSLQANEAQALEDAIINADNLNVSKLALKFVSSDNSRLKNFGLELLTLASTSKSQFFMPNEFYMAFAEKGLASEPFLIEIIENTPDDFCREWASELYVDIYFHNKPKEDPRRTQLDIGKNAEKSLYQTLSNLMEDKDQLEKMVSSGISPADQIRAAWGSERRYPMKLMQVVKLLDNMNSANITAVSLQASKILSTYNFNYDILNRVGGKPLELPLPPVELKLKYLMHMVFGDNTDNTFQWFHKKDGGFTRQDALDAISRKDTPEIIRMSAMLRSVLCLVLRGKLLIGLGNHELQILRYFYFATLDDSSGQSSQNILVIRNNTGKPAPLTISRRQDEPTTQSAPATQPTMDFMVPSQSSFVWLVPNGNITISANKNNTAVRLQDMPVFEDKPISLANSDLTININ